ncbi:MAG: response regulator, partial [Gemmataceae bacterium]|nr:response regulator [Gemmataceae bacterium]
RAAASGEPYGLVLADSVMPAPDGFSLAAQLKAEPGLAGAVVMMLGSADHALSGEKCRELGVKASILKPLKQSELLDTILGVVSAGAGRKARPSAMPESSMASLPPLRVLLAEDNEVNQHFAMRVLQRAGHSAVVAANGRLALGALEKQEFDLVLMDLQMPEMGGFEATAAIREKEAREGGHLPILALTAHAMKGDRERCLQAGMDGYVSKPIREQDLYLAIEQALRDHAPHVLARPRPAPPSRAEAPPEPPPVDEFDLQASLERCGDDRALLRELIDMFIAELPRWLADLDQALAEKDRVSSRRLAHSIKGAALNFGAAATSDAAYAVEKMCDEGRFDEVPPALAHLRSMLAVLTPKLAGFQP